MGSVKTHLVADRVLTTPSGRLGENQRLVLRELLKLGQGTLWVAYCRSHLDLHKHAWRQLTWSVSQVVAHNPAVFQRLGRDARNWYVYRVLPPGEGERARLAELALGVRP